LIGPERSDINQLNSLLSTPLQSSTLTEFALDLDQGSGWTTRFRLRIQTALSGSLLVSATPGDLLKKDSREVKRFASRRQRRRPAVLALRHLICVAASLPV